MDKKPPLFFPLHERERARENLSPPLPKTTLRERDDDDDFDDFDDVGRRMAFYFVVVGALVDRERRRFERFDDDEAS